MSNKKSTRTPGRFLMNGMILGSVIGIVYGLLLLGPAMENVGVGLVIGIAVGTGTGAGIGATIEGKQTPLRPQTKREKKLKHTIIALGILLIILTVVAMVVFNS